MQRTGKSNGGHASVTMATVAFLFSFELTIELLYWEDDTTVVTQTEEYEARNYMWGDNENDCEGREASQILAE